MRKMSKSFATILLLNTILLSHHAMEYIEIESYTTARGNESVFHLHYDYMVDESNNPTQDHWEFTPGISYGLTNSLMVDAHTHFSKFGTGHLINPEQYSPWGPSPFLEAMAFAIQYRLPETWPVDIAIAGIYEEPFQRSRDLLDGQCVLEGILILSHDFGIHSNICANFKFGKDGDKTVTRWALGAKTPLSQDAHGIQAGLEILGDIDRNWSVLPGVYFPVGQNNITLKTGLELGKNLENLRVNITLMLRF